MKLERNREWLRLELTRSKSGHPTAKLKGTRFAASELAQGIVVALTDESSSASVATQTIDLEIDLMTGARRERARRQRG